MREIKFRLWNIDYKDPIMEYFSLTNNVGVLGRLIGKPVMQYTGIKDKNGNDIYEGDVIKNTQAEVNIVHWFWDSWCYQNYHAESLPLGDHGNPFIDYGLTSHEIIGNIYDNPEFLKTVHTNG